MVSHVAVHGHVATGGDRERIGRPHRTKIHRRATRDGPAKDALDNARGDEKSVAISLSGAFLLVPTLVHPSWAGKEIGFQAFPSEAGSV